MLVESSLAVNENTLTGEASEYRTLARTIRAGTGSFALRTDAETLPGTEPLAEVVVTRTATEAVLLSVDRTARRFTIEGPEHLLEIVASELDASAEAHDQRRHVHLDPFPGHFYLDERSAQLIIHESTAD